jgi:hypothetical protein
MVAEHHEFLKEVEAQNPNHQIIFQARRSMAIRLVTRTAAITMTVPGKPLLAMLKI